MHSKGAPATRRAKVKPPAPPTVLQQSENNGGNLALVVGGDPVALPEPRVLGGVPAAATPVALPPSPPAPLSTLPRVKSQTQTPQCMHPLPPAVVGPASVEELRVPRGSPQAPQVPVVSSGPASSGSGSKVRAVALLVRVLRGDLYLLSHFCASLALVQTAKCPCHLDGSSPFPTQGLKVELRLAPCTIEVQSRIETFGHAPFVELVCWCASIAVSASFASAALHGNRRGTFAPLRFASLKPPLTILPLVLPSPSKSVLSVLAKMEKKWASALTVDGPSLSILLRDPITLAPIDLGAGNDALKVRRTVAGASNRRMRFPSLFSRLDSRLD